MHTSGRNIGGRLGPFFVILALFAGVALATEDWVQDLPGGDAYQVAAVLVPGPGGAEVADVKGQGHVNFRVTFGADLTLSVNGVDAGVYQPVGAYGVNISCWKAGGQWFATTRIVDQAAGVVLFEQVGYPMPGAADKVHAAGEHVMQLAVDG